MIPVRLIMRNFMCYRDDTPPVEFDSVHTAVLSGENGAGKSALLAAMTYALWGEARENVSDEDLITQGENDMSVDFEFRLGDQRYRVLRKRTRRNNRGMLTFQVGDEGTWRDISGHTLRETQKLITEKLRMDYATFTNSAFLMQGRADAFTTKTPTERKEILATILGLHSYDTLAEQARGESRERENKRRELGGQVEELDRQIAAKPQVEAMLAEATTALALAEADLDRLTAEESATTMQVESLRGQQKELENVQGRMAQDQRDANTLRTDVSNLRTQIALYDSLLGEQATIEREYKRFVLARDRESALTTALREQSRLDKDRERYERLLEAARNELTSSIRVHHVRIEELKSRIANRAANEKQLAQLRAEVEGFARLDTQAQELRAERDQKLQESSGVEGENKKLVERMNELKARRDAFVQAAAEAAQHGKDHCPMCNAMLDNDGRDRVLASYESDIAAGRELYRTNQRRVGDLKNAIADLDKRIADLDDRLKPRKSKERQEQDLTRTVREAAEAAEKLAQEEAELKKLQQQLDSGDFGGEAPQRLAEVRARLAELRYDPDEHERVRVLRGELAPYEEKYRQLLEAREKAEGAKANLALKDEALRQREARFNKERLIAQELQAALRDLPDLEIKQKSQQNAVRVARVARGEVADRRSRAEAQLHSIENAIKRKAALGKDFEQATYEKSIYDELAKAFGKSGVQAMIIESIMPELQDEANALLGRMTDGRMFLTFETQRQAKTTDSTIETLDIKISDDNGVARRYELFSGGEAFRINFAVRIALSKLLARRAGAQLQTLIIDEGFGSQDEQGRERLIAAIRSIEYDFEKILVITHIQDLKDEFPSRIEVMRTAGGSIVSVN